MNKKALVIDNDFFFVEFLTEILKKRGYEVVKAYDGKEGLTKLDEVGKNVDCVFVDMVMPKIDGEEFIRYARRRFPEAGFPIIAIAGNIIEVSDRINSIGADYYIPKGAVDAMEVFLNDFVERMEKGELSFDEEDNILQYGKTYPRRITLELMQMVRSLKGVVESVGFGILVTDLDQRVINANRQALDMLKKPMDEVINRHIALVFPEKDRELLKREMDSIMNDEELERTSIYLHIGNKKLLTILSIYQIEDEKAGWILAV